MMLSTPTLSIPQAIQHYGGGEDRREMIEDGAIPTLKAPSLQCLRNSENVIVKSSRHRVKPHRFTDKVEGMLEAICEVVECKL